MSVRWQGMSGCAQVLTASIAARTASPCGKTGVRATALASSRASQADRSCPPSAALAADPASASTRRARGNRMWGQRFCNRPHGVAMSSPERRVWPATASASSPRMSANSPTAAWLLSKWHAALPMPRRLTGRAIGARRRPQRLRAVSDGSAAVPEGNDSLSDEGDFEVSRELEEFDVERFRRASAHLDLMWNVEKKPKPAPCDCCEGSGRRRCEYCHGTGAMMVGHERFCSLEQGCKPCPVCNSTGDVKCFHCNGTGFRAAWLEPGCPVDSP